MKEAAGEANMTVVTIILIGVIVAIATPIVTSMMDNTHQQAKCMNEGKCWDSASKQCIICGTAGTGTGTGTSTP